MSDADVAGQLVQWSAISLVSLGVLAVTRGWTRVLLLLGVLGVAILRLLT